MTAREDVARAMACFETSDDIALLHQLIEEVAPKAKKLVARHLSRGAEESIPPPADIRSARSAATLEEAVRIFRQIDDFSLLQAMARCIGQRIEAIEIVASAEFPEGARVVVPGGTLPGKQPALLAGSVEATGTILRVRLDNGETWEGPPSRARLETVT